MRSAREPMLQEPKEQRLDDLTASQHEPWRRRFKFSFLRRVVGWKSTDEVASVLRAHRRMRRALERSKLGPRGQPGGRTRAGGSPARVVHVVPNPPPARACGTSGDAQDASQQQAAPPWAVALEHQMQGLMQLVLKVRPSVLVSLSNCAIRATARRWLCSYGSGWRRPLPLVAQEQACSSSRLLDRIGGVEARLASLERDAKILREQVLIGNLISSRR